MADLPIACTVSADALKIRREGLLSALLGRAEEHEELPDGHRLGFASACDTLSLIASTVDDAERDVAAF